ncbi:MAG: hypothetical protein PUB59_05340 [Firmicutes bacterium]|nr:hypothetical protein [Bacillota bacterium]
MEEMETTSPVPRRRHSRDNRYRMLEKYMTYALLGDAGVFVLYLISAGFGIGWLKAFFAVVGIVGSALGLVYLYFTRELLRPRSLWMSAGLSAVLVCILVSLLVNYPSPNPYKKGKDSTKGSTPASTDPSDTDTKAADLSFGTTLSI